MSTREILNRERKRKAAERKRRRDRREKRIAELRERWAKFGIDERLDVLGACVFIGGSRPINDATLWRGVKRGDYRPPDKVAAQSVRFTRDKLKDDLARIAERDSQAA